MGLVTLRGVRAGEELFAPYVALGQSVEDRRRELSSRFSPGRAAATRGTGGMATSPSSPSSLPLQQQEELPCGCPRCMYEAEGDARSCGREMLKVWHGLTDNLGCTPLPSHWPGSAVNR